MERLPLIIDGAECGSVTLESEGLYTLVRAELAPREGIVRLSLYGEGEFYLGVAAPENGALRLCRRLSAAEAARLPRPLSHGGAAGERPAPAETFSGWCVHADGTLTRPGFLALPCALRRSVPGLRCERIGAREYLIFRT